MEDAQPLRQFKNGGRGFDLFSRRHTHSLHVFIFLAAFLTLAGVDPAASASAFRSPSFFNDASHRAAAAEPTDSYQPEVVCSSSKIDYGLTSRLAAT
jgi:hypothetical protein